MATATRTRKPTPTVAQRKTEQLTRRIAIMGALPVALVALWISYQHIHEVTLLAGESSSTAAIMALSVDGLMLVSGVAIVAKRGGKVAYVAFCVGVLASLAANVVSAEGNPVSYVVAAWPALALTLTSELLLRLCVPTKRKPATRTRRAVTTRKTRDAVPVLRAVAS